MKTFNIELTLNTPMLMHADDIDHADRMDAWKADNKKSAKEKSRAGDDRTPPWRWTGYCYHDGAHVAMPVENIIRMLVDAGKSFEDSTAKSKQTTLKRAVVTGLAFPTTHFAIVLPNGRQVAVADLAKLVDLKSYDEHRRWASAYGFELYARRATVGASKHVRVRPKFPAGTRIVGQVETIHASVEEGDVLSELFKKAGSAIGLGDWRPSAPKSPGPYGRFTASVKEKK